jgi:methanogenic corrinoid protein MtbC1
MSSDYDDQSLTPTPSDGLTLGQDRVLSRDHVSALAAEVLQQVARRANDARRARDSAEIAAASLALTSGGEADAVDALTALDDPLSPLDWFLTERLGPIAKEIGDLWTTDRITFLQATVGASRIYSYLRYRRRPPSPPRLVRKSATFVLVPGDMHTVGISAATDVFRNRGWDITLLVGHSHDELVSRFESSTDQIFGFSAGSGHSLAALGRIVVALTVSHPDAHVIVSGQIAENADVIRALPGIDACERDFDAAYAWLETQTA